MELSKDTLMNKVVVFSAHPTGDLDHTVVCDGNVFSVNHTAKSVVIHYRHEGKNLTDEVRYSDLVAIADAERGDYMTIEHFTGHFVDLRRFEASVE